MKVGLRIGVERDTIDYKGLRQFNAEAAQRACPEFIEGLVLSLSKGLS